MKKISLYLALCVVVFTTGCPKYKPRAVDFNNSNAFVSKINTYFADQQKSYRAAVNSGDTARARLIRNDILENALPFIDEVYMDFITDIQRGRDRDNFVADLVELGASAAVGITNGERPLQILGVALTAFRGGRRSADLNFYKEQTTPILISKMDGNRARVRAVILTREKEEVSTYPVGAAIGDIVDYYNAGTLVRAFTALQEDTAVQTREAKEDLLVLQGVPLTRPSNEATTAAAVKPLAVLRTLKASLDSKVPDEVAAATAKLKQIYLALEADPDTARLLKVAEISSAEPDGQKLLQGIRDISRQLATDDPVRSKIDEAIVAHGR